MGVLLIILSIVLTWFACAVLSYVSIATMVGPWVAPSLVLITAVFMKIGRKKRKEEDIHQKIALVQTVGSVGGLIATAVGFTFPTLYFLDAKLFNQWMETPLAFFALIGSACIAAGGLGLWLARSFANRMVIKEQLAFPVSDLISETIVASSGREKIMQLLKGFSLTGIICFFRDGLKVGKFLQIRPIMPTKNFFLFKTFLGKHLHFSIIPMFWAVGYIAGPAIVMPLLIGLISKYVIVYPLVNYAHLLPFRLFAPTTTMGFVMALCAGLAISEALLGVLKWPKMFKDLIRSVWKPNFLDRIKSIKLFQKKDSKSGFKIFEAALAIAVSFAFLSYCKFSFPAQLFIILATILTTYQISYFGAKIGLVPFGRFATFVMLPSLLMFKLDAFQITMLCVFVVICGAASSDLLFDYKIGQTFNISFNKIYKYQWFGLLITAVSLGACLWFLFTNLQLGSADLFAQRGQNRALLIQSLSFDWRVLGIGVLYGFILRKFKVSPTMVFGGLLMQNCLTIGFVIGAIGSMLSKKPKEQFAFFSGVFASESVWLIGSIILGML